MPRHQICSIPGCCSRSDRPEFEGVKFHRLPQEPDQRYKWLVSIKRHISVSENSRICSLHFEGSEKTVNSQIPTIFPWSKSVKQRHPPTVRYPIPSKKQKPEKQYHILKNVVPLTLVNSVDNIWGVCCALSLFHPPLVTDSLSDNEL